MSLRKNDNPATGISTDDRNLFNGIDNQLKPRPDTVIYRTGVVSSAVIFRLRDSLSFNST
jgi:hypothetical protein